MRPLPITVTIECMVNILLWISHFLGCIQRQLVTLGCNWFASTRRMSNHWSHRLLLLRRSDLKKAAYAIWLGLLNTQRSSLNLFFFFGGWLFLDMRKVLLFLNYLSGFTYFRQMQSIVNLLQLLLLQWGCGVNRLTWWCCKWIVCLRWSLASCSYSCLNYSSAIGASIHCSCLSLVKQKSIVIGNLLGWFRLFFS